MSATVEVLSMDLANRDDSIKAFCKVRLGCVAIAGVRVIQQEGAAPWVALPQTPIRAKADGSGAGWRPVVEIMNKEILAQLQEEVLGCYELELKAAPIDLPPVRLPIRGRRAWA